MLKVKVSIKQASSKSSEQGRICQNEVRSYWNVGNEVSKYEELDNVEYVLKGVVLDQHLFLVVSIKGKAAGWMSIWLWPLGRRLAECDDDRGMDRRED